MFIDVDINNIYIFSCAIFRKLHHTEVDSMNIIHCGDIYCWRFLLVIVEPFVEHLTIRYFTTQLR